MLHYLPAYLPAQDGNHVMMFRKDAGRTNVAHIVGWFFTNMSHSVSVPTSLDVPSTNGDTAKFAMSPSPDVGPDVVPSPVGRTGRTLLFVSVGRPGPGCAM